MYGCIFNMCEFFFVFRRLQNQLESYKENAKSKPANKDQVCWNITKSL